MPWWRSWEREKGIHLDPPPQQGFNTPSRTTAVAMISLSGEISGIAPRSRAAACEKSKGASTSHIKSGIGIWPTSCTPIQNRRVQPTQKSNKRGGIPRDTCPNIPPQGIEGARQAFIDLFHTQIKSHPVSPHQQKPDPITEQGP